MIVLPTHTKQDVAAAMEAKSKALSTFMSWRNMTLAGHGTALDSEGRSYIDLYMQLITVAGDNARTQGMVLRQLYELYYVKFGGAGEAPEFTWEEDESRRLFPNRATVG